MVKKLFTLMMGLGMFLGGASAQVEPDDILYWVGSGDGEAVVTVLWSTPDTGLAWGVRYDTDMGLDPVSALDSIAQGDSRFSYTVDRQGWSVTGISALTFTDGATTFSLSATEIPCVYVDDLIQADPDEWEYAWCDDVEGTITYAADCYLVYTHVAPVTVGTPATNPVDATIDFADILYWVGEGSNEAAFIISFAEPDTALAWGFRYSTANIQNMIDSIAAADPRLTIVGNPSNGGELYFVNAPGDTLRLSPVDAAIGYNFWWTNLNGVSVASFTTGLNNGDVFKFGDMNSATGWDFQYGYYMQEAWTTEVHPVSDPNAPVDPQPVEATIAASDIVYWVGTGANEVVMAVNWADTALAWGYRFDGEKTVSDMMSDIAAADPRFSYTMDGGYLGDILFVVAEGDTLHKQAYSYWESKQNGVSDAGMGQALANGAFEKWAEPAAGIVVDSFSYEWDSATYWSYIYVYPMEISPVSVPQPVGIGGVEGATVSVYPNPVADMLTVSGVSGRAVLFDMRGSVVASFEANGAETRVDIRGLANGVYMLRVADSVAKIVVRH